ncbi:MAG: NADH:ubiquinone reductase (Na(+)-transporting) subunit F, partial [Candidatus Omnitrophota bacterium]
MSFVFFILLSMGVFSGIILLIVAGLLFVGSRFVGEKTCRIFINDDRAPIDVMGGKSLLATLADKEIYLPSACGGKGTCSACKCQVFEGAGEILPTESAQLTRKERQEKYRLSCQVKVRKDIRIKIPQDILAVKMFPCVVKSNRNVSPFIKELVLGLPESPAFEFRAGAYVQIEAPVYAVDFKQFDIPREYLPDWEKNRLLEIRADNDEPVAKAYSIASPPAEKGGIVLNVRLATPPAGKNFPPGIVSSFLFSLKPRDQVRVSGPYGEFFIKETKREMVYIGGGVGMAPLRSQLFHLLY